MGIDLKQTNWDPAVKATIPDSAINDTTVQALYIHPQSLGILLETLHLIETVQVLSSFTITIDFII